MTHHHSADLEMIDAYLDNELTKEERLAFETRLSREPELADALTTAQRFRIAWRTRLRQTSVPDGLRSSVQAAIATPAAQPGWLQQLVTQATAPKMIRPYIAGAFVLIVAVLLGGAIFWFNQTPPVEEHSIFRQVAGKHMAYLKGPALLLDVAGGPAKIANWFTEHVPFPVSVPTLAEWRLEGGRLGEVHHQPAAHLIYDRAGQHLSLTLFRPQTSDFPTEARTRLNNDDFYVSSVGQQPVVLWRVGDLGYALTTDAALSPDELLRLASVLKDQLEFK